MYSVLYLFSFFFFLLFIFLSFGGLFFFSDYSYVLEFYIFCGNFMEFSFVFFFDFMSFFFFSFILLISSIVFLYSGFYMHYNVYSKNSDNSRFFYLLFLFVFSMFFLVFSGSWIVVMLGWDGLGLVSFLLVVYYNNSSSLDSGLLTIFTNRIGDSLFILSFVFLFFNGWLSLCCIELFSSFFILLIFIVGCFTKSAQIPFSSWLPAAMAAPTPVSSLVHSSTLVTAGVYLLIRFNHLLFSFFYFISFFSLITMFLAGVCALYEKDFKKVVAMSTLSQLGFMIFSISIGCWVISFLHMVFHAFFKSFLFLSTGSLMHSLLGSQDSRLFGSLGSSFFSKVYFVSSCICLMGFPFSLGFYSKDLIIGCFITSSFNLYFLLFLLSCVFTVGYSFRLISESFMYFPSFFPSFSFSENFYFFAPVLILFLLCTFIGNFFFFFFSFPFMFSFFDCFIGIFVIILGLLLFLFKPFTFFFEFFTNSMSFLSFIPTPMINSMYCAFQFSLDSSWFELLGGQGLMQLLSFFYSHFILFFYISFSFFLFFFFLFII
uniref:NADH:ubiquinone reductase (H(+)-translocating) n=1 Tax=Histiostoma feroniarum TaxID=334618 RepID=A0A2Z4MAM8_9ACAR|nr:NADH dehydrogenase subunit 5 [Histiostoma feroniarum]AWX53528.1 NADH dehydrogenase subunit 5 [Histiostoma feroniarum]